MLGIQTIKGEYRYLVKLKQQWELDIREVKRSQTYQRWHQVFYPHYNKQHQLQYSAEYIGHMFLNQIILSIQNCVID